VEQRLSAFEKRIEIRWSDLDSSRHVNNAVYWSAVEETLWPLEHAVLEYRRPIDLDDAVELRVGGGELAFAVAGELRAAASTR